MANDDRTPWFVVKANIGSNPKLAELPNDSARWGWVAGVLAEAKKQSPQGRFTSRQHFTKAVPEFARFLKHYIAKVLIEVAPDLCMRCRKVWGDVPDGWLVVHDWHAHQRDPGAADRAAEWREQNAWRMEHERIANAARTQEERDANENRTPGDTGTSRGRATTGTVTGTKRRSPAGEDARAGADMMAMVSLVEELTSRPWGYGAGNRVAENLRYDVRNFGVAVVEAALRTESAKGIAVDPNVLAMDAHKALNPMSGPRVNGHAKPSGKASAEDYDALFQTDEDEPSEAKPGDDWFGGHSTEPTP